MPSDHTNYFHETQKIKNGEHVNVSLYFEAQFDPTDDTSDGEALAFRDAVGGLEIPTGADEITWGYGLNTKRIPTYGGEVVQVLSMYADKMTIKGTCRTYNEMNKIYNFFKKYIEYTTGAKGINTKRHQKFLKFKYPARRWSFIIMVDDISSMRMSKDISAPVWSLTAEIVSENDRYALGSERADRWASALHQPMIQKAVKSGKSYGPRNFKLLRNGDAYGDQMTAAERRGKISQNFDALVASWATGDITTLRNNPLVDPPQSAEEIWTKNFGDYAGVGGVAGGGGSAAGTTADGGGTSGLSDLSVALAPEVVAMLAAEAFKKHGYTAAATDKDKLTLAVAVSAAESGWKSQAINHNGTAPSTRDYSEYIDKYVKEFPTKDNNYDLGLWQINTYWTVEQILLQTGTTYDKNATYDEKRKVMADAGVPQKVMDDPAACAMMMAGDSQGGTNWNPWCAYTNGSYESHMAEAAAAVTKYLANPEQYAGGGTAAGGAGAVPPTGSVSQKAVAYALPEVGVTETPPESNLGPRVEQYQSSTGARGQAWCASFVTWCFKQAGKNLSGFNTAYCPAWVDSIENSKNGLIPVQQNNVMAGDVALYDWGADGTSDHIGLVISSVDSAGDFTAIEGNTSSDNAGDQSNGGAVCRKKRNVSNVIVFGRVR